MDLQHPIAKAISVATFFSLTLAPEARRSPGAVPSPAQAPVPASASTGPVPSGAAAERDAAPAGEPCPKGMVLIEGDYCPDAVQVCLKWLDPPPYQNLRCGEYARPSRCRGDTVRRRFCIDREEYAEAAAPGAEALPVVSKNWGEAKALCEARGARLCKESEWEFACEGTEMSPYPYGWKRDSSVCNLDRTDLGGPQDKLTDHRAPASAFPGCVSPFGVHNMVGNVDEWVERENMAPPNRSALRGGWWLPGRNRCRAATLGHDESYQGKQVGFRCCKDAP